MKQYFTGFFTSLCLTASVFIFMGSMNKNLGDIMVNSITVVDEQNKIITKIKPFKFNNTTYRGIAFHNSKNETVSYLYTDDNGGGMSFKAYGKEIAYIGNSPDGGFLKTFSKDTKETVYVGTSQQGGGIISTKNENGELTGIFGTSKKNDGVAVLFDGYGDVGWEASGK